MFGVNGFVHECVYDLCTFVQGGGSDGHDASGGGHDGIECESEEVGDSITGNDDDSNTGQLGNGDYLPAVPWASIHMGYGRVLG